LPFQSRTLAPRWLRGSIWGTPSKLRKINRFWTKR